MKFGTTLSNALHPDWKFYYLDYSQLKLLLKVDGFAEDNELRFNTVDLGLLVLIKVYYEWFRFIEALETELDKIASFCNTKVCLLRSVAFLFYFSPLVAY